MHTILSSINFVFIKDGPVVFDEIRAEEPVQVGLEIEEELFVDEEPFTLDIGTIRKSTYNYLYTSMVTSNLTTYMIFDNIRNQILKTHKVPKFAYSIILEPRLSERQMTFWKDLDCPGQVSWEKIHLNNFKCTISMRIRSFYFKLFHRAIGLNDFLYKIKRKDSPNCSLCKAAPETYVHLFI